MDEDDRRTFFVKKDVSRRELAEVFMKLLATSQGHNTRKFVKDMMENANKERKGQAAAAKADDAPANSSPGNYVLSCTTKGSLVFAVISVH